MCKSIVSTLFNAKFLVVPEFCVTHTHTHTHTIPLLTKRGGTTYYLSVSPIYLKSPVKEVLI